jgi:hypothetical protein
MRSALIVLGSIGLFRRPGKHGKMMKSLTHRIDEFDEDTSHAFEFDVS